jgi:hypothetical protein
MTVILKITLILQANPRLENYVVEHDGEVELCSEMEVKEEPESDCDEYQLKIEEGEHEAEDIYNKAHGQTSLDLASSKKDVS